jgi:MFS family permease
MTGQFANTLPGALNGTFQQAFHTAGSQLTWISAAFLVPLVVFELTFGVIGDLYGRRKLFAAGAVLLAACGVVCASAPSVQVMWAGLVLGGLGTGMLFPASLSLVTAVARTARERARVIAIWAGFLSAGGAASPLVSGLLAQYSSWRWAYVIVAVSAAVTVVLALRVADSSAPQGRRLDIPGQVTFAIGLVAALYAAVQGSSDGWGRPEIIGGFVLGAVALAAFVVVELRSTAPLLNLGLFRNRSFAVVAVVTLVGMFGFLSCNYSMSMWLGAVQHQDALRVGVVLLAGQVPAFVGIPLVSRLLRSVSPRWPLTIGFACIAASGLTCSRFSISSMNWVRFLPPAVLVGVGFALTVGSITAATVLTVPGRYAGMASAMTNLLRDLGFTLGPVLVGAAALSDAGGLFGSGLAASAGTLPVAQFGAAKAIGTAGGPLAVVSLPPGVPGAAAHAIALTALGSGYQLTFGVSGLAALAAAVLAFVALPWRSAAG